MPPGLHAAPSDPAEINPAARPRAWMVLVLLILINLFNYIDRQLLIAVLPKVEESLLDSDPTFAGEPSYEPDEQKPGFSRGDDSRKTKGKLGGLTFAFMVSFLLASLLFGWLAEQMSRWLIVGVGVMVLSLASGATGLASLYLVLLLTRCFAGVGEAAYGPVAPAMLSESYPVQARARVLGLFYLAVPVGVATGYIFGGYMADTPGLGWRWAFFLLVPPGILLGLLCLRMREPPRQTHVRVRLRDWFVLARTPSYVLNTLGMTAMMFAVGGIGSWMAYYLYEREARFAWSEEAAQVLRENGSDIPDDVLVRLGSLNGEIFPSRTGFESRLEQQLPAVDWSGYKNKLIAAARQGPTLTYINTMCGLMGVTAGILGILIGSFIADRMRLYFDGAYFLVSGWSLLAALPCFLCILITPLTWSWAFIFLTTLCLFFSMGPTSAILANVAHPSMRATAFALNLFCIHAFGDAISPTVIGLLADRSNLRTAFVLVSLILLLGGMLWLWGARYLQRDIELAPRRLGKKGE